MSDPVSIEAARPGVRRGLLLLCATFLIGLLFGELLVRAVLSAPPRWRHPQEAYVFDEKIGHRLAPGQRAFTHDKPVRINELGLRSDEEYATHPPRGTVRVLALGDSQTFGNGLEAHETWPAQLERELEHRSGGRSWQVLNAGIPATDTWQHEVLLERGLDRFRPQAVVLAFYVNDIQRPFTPRPGSHGTNPLRDRVVRAMKRSAVVCAALNSVRTLRHAIRPGRGFLAEHNVVTGQPDPLVEEGWQQVERSLRSMKQASDRYGARFTVCVLPRRDQVAAREPHRAFHDRIAEVARRHGIPVVDALEPLRAAYLEHGQELFIPWDGHNSSLANGVIADTLVDRMLAQRAMDSDLARIVSPR